MPSDIKCAVCEREWREHNSDFIKVMTLEGGMIEMLCGPCFMAAASRVPAMIMRQAIDAEKRWAKMPHAEKEGGQDAK